MNSLIWREHDPVNTLIWDIEFILLASRTMKEYILVDLSHYVCGNFDSSHRKLTQTAEVIGPVNSQALLHPGTLT